MLVGYARVSTQEQDLALQLDALRNAGCERIFEEKASGAQRERPELQAALGYMRPGDTLVVWKLDRLARSLKQLIETVEALGTARHRPALADRGDRHHHLRRPAGVPPVRGPGRVRARRDPRAHARRPAGGPRPRPHRWPAPCPRSPRTSPPPRPCCAIPRSPWPRSRGGWAWCPRPSTAICPGRAPPPSRPRAAEPRHADQARAAVLLPDRLAAGQPLGPVRARPGPLRALRPAARRDRAPSRRRPLVGRGAADLARWPGPRGPLPCPGRAAAGADDQGGAGGGASRPRPRRIAAGGTATSGRCASGATCCTTGPSTAAASGSPCAGDGPWATCSRGPIRPE